MNPEQPNVVFVFADQWRAQAAGYAGNALVQTPHLDRLAGESVHCTTAVAGCPVCSPYRASLLTGRYPLTHGVFLNDVCLNNEAVSLAQAFAAGGYDTAYIGKWHLDGHGRSNFIPRQRRQGFDAWHVLECTHDYNHSKYFGDSDEPKYWDGYDAIAQTRQAREYLRSRGAADKPFVLVLSWGPPHNPYQTAPEAFRRLYDVAEIPLRPNVPDEAAERAREDLAGYYAHCSALDACVGDLRATLAETGLDANTLFVFTSDHGDLLGSQGEQRKQKPYDESILVPLLWRLPGTLPPRRVTAPINAPDLMPTLLGLCGLEIPQTVEGRDYSAHLAGQAPAPAGSDAALIAAYAPFGEWPKVAGGREYRGVRTERYTYTRDLTGPWLLFDNQADPYQQDNLVDRPEHAELQAEMQRLLQERLAETHDEFLPAEAYIEQWHYPVDQRGTVPYTS